MSLYEFQEVGRTLRATKDLIVLSVLADGVQTVDEVQTDYYTGEKGSVASNIRRLLRSKLVRYASTGRDVLGGAVNDRRKYYCITAEGKRILRAFRWLLAK